MRETKENGGIFARRWRRSTGVGVAVAICVVAILIGVPASVPSRTSGAPAAPLASNGYPVETPVVSLAPSFPTPIHHVILVWSENRELGQEMRDAPFLKQMATTYSLAGQFYSVRHGSEPDYLAATGAIDPVVYRTGKYNITNVADQLNAAGMTWQALMEGMPETCDNQDSWGTGYENTHDPFPQFTDVWQHRDAYCRDHVLPFTLDDWTAELNSSNVPNYVFITPDIFDDQHSGSIQAGSKWLQSVISPIINSSIWSSTAVIMTFDEGVDTSNSGFNQSFGGNIYTAVISPYARMGYNSTHPYQTYSILTTTEWLLGLGNLGTANDNATTHPPMKDLFSFTGRLAPTPATVVTGFVTNTTTGVGIGGAHVVITSGTFANGTDTGPGGAFTLRVNPGRYEFYVTANNYENLRVDKLAESTSPMNFSLTAAPNTLYTVSGKVTDSKTKAGISNAQILITATDVRKETNTSSSGSWSWTLKDGTYNVTASKSGFVSQTQVVEVEGANVGGINFALVPTAQSPAAAPNGSPSAFLLPLAGSGTRAFSEPFSEVVLPPLLESFLLEGIVGLGSVMRVL
ncbi:MAG: alkaline phosphatase family protein [Thermoplasmata archaeon]